MRKIKFNWGTGIALFIAIFLISSIVLIFLASRIEVDLVEKEYYPQGLQYQNDIDRMENFSRLGQEAIIVAGPDSLRFVLPAFFDGKKISGNVELYRPSDARLDVRDTLGSNSWGLPLEQISSGKYEFKAAWSCEGIDYTLQRAIIIE